MSYDDKKETMYDTIKDFLVDHSISELLNIVADVIENEEGE